MKDVEHSSLNFCASPNLLYSYQLSFSLSLRTLSVSTSVLAVISSFVFFITNYIYSFSHKYVCFWPSLSLKIPKRVIWSLSGVYHLFSRAWMHRNSAGLSKAYRWVNGSWWTGRNKQSNGYIYCASPSQKFPTGHRPTALRAFGGIISAVVRRRWRERQMRNWGIDRCKRPACTPLFIIDSVMIYIHDLN
jgi:hypothetical protein